MVAAHPVGDPFEAIGDGTRREILRQLSDGDKAVHEIAAALPISRPAVSRHLKLLCEAGLLERFKEGSWVFYRAVADELSGAILPADQLSSWP